MYFKIGDITPKIEVLYKEGLSKGLLIGHSMFDEHYSFKLGSCTYLMAPPASGKTELMFECLLNLSIKYGVKCAIFTPETGNHEEIAAELISKYCWKPFHKNYPGRLEEKSLYGAISWLSEHFYIIDPQDKDLSVKEFYELIDEIEKKENIKINFTLGDPWNEFKHSFAEDHGRQDLYIESTLGYIRKNAKKTGRHNIITTHCRDQQVIQDSETKIWYYPKPTVRDYAGGQAWFRKGLGMLGEWRPPFGMINPKTGVPYQDNEVHIDIQKAKPKGIGKLGTVVMYYDYKNGHYYDNVHGRITYAWNKDFEGKDIVKEFNNDVFRQLPKERDYDHEITPPF